MPEVLDRQCDGIHAQPFSQAVDHQAKNKVELRIAHPAHHAAGDMVGVNGIRFHLDVWNRGEGGFRDLRRGKFQGKD